jgi:hypothetical protein
MARYRFVAITVTALCLVLAAFTVWFEFSAYTDYRTPDFTKASEGPITGTCVEAVTEDQLKAAWYDKADWDCSDNNKKNLANLLAVSVHTLYEKRGTLDADGTRVLNSVVSTTQGVIGHQITKTQAYNALKLLGTPNTDCASIYAGATELATIPDSLDPVVVCDSETPVDGTPENTNTDKLYTHCLMQFSYGRSYQTSGTFGIPKVGEEASPMILPVIGTNSSTTWEDRARILVGTRYAPAPPSQMWVRAHRPNAPLHTRPQLGLRGHRLHHLRARLLLLLHGLRHLPAGGAHAGVQHAHTQPTPCAHLVRHNCTLLTCLLCSLKFAGRCLLW